MFPDEGHEVIGGDQRLLGAWLGPLLLPPLLLVQVGGVEELGGQAGACGLDPAHHLQEHAPVVVVEQGDGGAAMAQSTRSTHLGGWMDDG